MIEIKTHDGYYRGEKIITIDRQMMITETAAYKRDDLDLGWIRQTCPQCGSSVLSDPVCLDESGVDGVFCDDVCAEAYIISCVLAVAEES